MNRSANFMVFNAIAVVLTVLMLIVFLPAAMAQSESDSTGNMDNHVYHVDPVQQFVTEDGETVTYTTIGASVGDVYIDGDNNQYVVRRVQDDQVFVELQGKADMPDVRDDLRALEQARSDRQGADQTGFIGRLLSAVGKSSNVDVGIYHTHNAESYRPTSGVDFKDEGDVLKVGQRLKEEFEKLGYSVQWSGDSHLPHDGQAYMRSRRTAADISKDRPATILDVHRDAIPRADSYTTEVEGEPMTQVRLVVGRQNQNREANLEYAKRIKAIADEKYPGLVKGIYHARGNYNQDLGPKMILLEFGTHLTSLDDALKSAPLAAEVISAAAGLTPGSGGGRGEGAAGIRTVLWILLFVGIGAVGWVFLNKEGAGGLRSSLARMFGGKGPTDGEDSE